MNTSTPSAGCGCGCFGYITGVILALIVLAICLIAQVTLSVAIGSSILTFALVFGGFFAFGVAIDVLDS